MDSNTAPGADVLDVGDLSRVLRKSASSILADRARAPHRLPPACTPPGTRQPLWILGDVLAWLRQHQEPAAPAPSPAAQAPRKRGRPTKAEAAARAAGSGK